MSRHRLIGVVLLVAAALLALLPRPLIGQETGELPGPQELHERLEAWTVEAESAKVPAEGSAPGDALPDRSALPEARLTLELLEQQIESARRGAELEKAAELAARQLEAGPAESLDAPPFDFDMLDHALDRRAAEEQAELLANEAIDAALGELESAERARREAVAGLWGERASNARIELARQRLKNVRQQQSAARCRYDLAKQVASYVGKHLRATPEELESALDAIADRRLELESRRLARGRDAELAERRWHEAQARAERAPSEAARAEAEARRAALELEDSRRRLLDEQLGRLRLEAEMWRHRFAAALDGDLDDGPELSLDEIGSQLARQAKARDLELAAYRTARRGLVRDAAADVGPWLGSHREALISAIDLLEEDLADIERLRFRLKRVRAECTPRGLRLGEWLRASWSALVRAWHFELLVVDDRPITVGKALLALLLILIGYRVSKRLARALGDLLRSRLHIGSGVAAALQGLVFYLLLVFFFLWAFQLVGIPLTVFTVLGGVVAIGIGFGSQNIVNNFISGLILLVEQPIKVGDLIEVDGVLGSVERIGLRSTRVRAGDNTHVIVPNSSFLEKNVLNWTVSDDVIRADLDVGVAYGSPAERVKSLIEKALSDEELVLDAKGWDVLFIEFGDNALHFRAYFWIRVTGHLDRLRATSAVRFRIEKLFREADITISFPQRDVHLDTLRPLEVRMVSREEGQHASEPADRTG